MKKERLAYDLFIKLRQRQKWYLRPAIQMKIMRLTSLWPSLLFALRHKTNIDFKQLEN